MPNEIDEGLHKPSGPIDGALRNWAKFEPSEAESLDIGEILDNVETIMGGVRFLIGRHRMKGEP